MENTEKNEVTPEFIVEAFRIMGAVPDLAIKNAQGYSVDGWVSWQALQAGAVGAGAISIPVAHLPLMLVDIAFLLHKMAYCCWGIGAIHGCKIESKEDFSIILGMYAGVITTETLSASIGAGYVYVIGTGVANAGLPGFISVLSSAAGTGVAEFGKALATKGIGKGIAKTISKGVGVGITMSAPVIEKVANKVALKVATKLGVKGAIKSISAAAGGFVPVLGALLAGGVNAYFVNSIAECANEYYRIKRIATNGN